jgi:HSP20 family protein
MVHKFINFNKGVIMNILNKSKSLSAKKKNNAGTSLFNLQNNINGLFDDFFMNPFSKDLLPSIFEDSQTTSPAINLSEKKKEYKLVAELPGVDIDDLDVTVGDGYVSISAKQEESKEGEEENYICREFCSSNFQRSFGLSNIADTENAEATFKNGILTVKIPKKHEALRKERKLKIK